MSPTEQNPVPVVARGALGSGDPTAERNRRFFQDNDVATVHLMSAPGSGKTRLLEVTLDRIKDRVSAAVVEGDVETDNDARRVARHGVPVVQLLTKGACHLDSGLVEEALGRIPLPRTGLLFIENVGSLDCTVAHDLGETLRTVCISVTEGDDKPEKYPGLFRRAGAMVVTKMDLLPHVDFDVDRAVAHARVLNPRLKVFRTSAVSGEGMDEWCEFLMDQAAREEPGCD